jgi:ketosteroid isomerase-like protein
MILGAKENADAIRGGYEAFNTADVERLTPLFDESVRWHVPGRSSLAGNYEGRDATFGFFGRLGQETGGTFQAQLRDLVAGGDLVVGLHDSRAKRGDKTLDVSVALVFQMQGGTIVEAWEHYGDMYAWDDFWQ